jgi:hypothetical protein
MKVKIKITSTIESKLAFVKSIKRCSNYGLKESKDIADWLSININKYKDVDLNDINGFKYELMSNNVKNVVLADNRDLNILKLGLGEKEEYLEYLSYYLINNEDNIKKSLSYLTKIQLIELLQKISI